MDLIISKLAERDGAVEIVERKGLGHPDTICDALAETFSRNLCRIYLQLCGEILHHNVDKALLCGGRAAPAFGGGEILAPSEIILAGRAIDEALGIRIPVEEVAIEGSRQWLRANCHALDTDRHVRVSCRIAPGSRHLRTLFAQKRSNTVPLANDTSIGVGYAPPSAVERLVLDVERRINARDRDNKHPAWGEDVKVMAIRTGEKVRLTLACAQIGRYLAHLDDYAAEKATLGELAYDAAHAHGFSDCEISVNAADGAEVGDIFLTVTGLSAEAGDDGEVGRGNRINGLITPCRPMSLEAAAGKNPVNHVGKLYNVLAHQIAEALVTTLPDVAAAQCLLVSQIGRPITEPTCVEVKLATEDGAPVEALRPAVDAIVAAALVRAPSLVDDFVAGRITLF